jgi:hypothetical protein
MLTIHKFPLTTQDKQVIQLPAFAQPLSLQTQHTIPCLWALVDTEQPLRDYVVLIYGTGHEVQKMPIGYEFLGTLQSANEGLVFHFFGYPAQP